MAIRTGFLGGTNWAGSEILTAQDLNDTINALGSGVGSVVYSKSNYAISGTQIGIFVVSGGNVGIGTTGPGAKLHVVSSIIKIEGTSPTGPNSPQMEFRESGSNAFWVITKRGSQYSGEPDQLIFSYYNGSQWFQAMNLKTNRDVIFNGNVGIGTTSPTEKLDITGGNAKITRLSGDTYSAILWLDQQNVGNNGKWAIALKKHS